MGGGWGKVSEQQAWESGASLDGSVKVGLGGLRTPGLHPSCPSLAFPTGLISGCPVAPFLLSGEGEGVGHEVTPVSSLSPVSPGFI